MRFQLLVVCLIASTGGVANTAAAQTSSDAFAMEAAVAQHCKPWLTGKFVMLDSRFGITTKDSERPAARTQAISRILGVPVAHAEDAIGCKATCVLADTRVNFAVALHLPVITGTTATVVVETYGVDVDGVHAITYSEVDILTKTNGVWKFTRIGSVSQS